MKRKSKEIEIPSMEVVEAELSRINYKDRYRLALRGTIFTLIVVAAIAILIATLWLPFLRIYGVSMTPTLQEGDFVCCLASSEYESGDLLAFYYNNKILIKRVIGSSGDWINMDADGNVYVNNILLDEPYLTEKAVGECDLEFPYQVPEDTLFVMGDKRSTSVDSRSSTVGCIAEEYIIGRLLVRIWPLERVEIF